MLINATFDDIRQIESSDYAETFRSSNIRNLCMFAHTFLVEQYINFPAQQCSEISKIYESTSFLYSFFFGNINETKNIKKYKILE